MVIDFFRSLNKTVKGKVEIGVPSTIPAGVPAQYDGHFPGTLFPGNCVR